MGAVTDVFVDFAGGLATQYLQSRVAGPSLSDLRGITPGAGFSMGMPQQNVLGVPFVDVIPEPPTVTCGAQPVYKKVCGVYKWVIPKKKRRKQLLSNSDASGLAKLKGLVGVGKTMDVWIATHS